MNTFVIAESIYLGSQARLWGNRCTVEIRPAVPLLLEYEYWMAACLECRPYFMYCCEYYWQNYYRKQGGYCCFDCFCKDFLMSIRERCGKYKNRRD